MLVKVVSEESTRRSPGLCEEVGAIGEEAAGCGDTAGTTEWAGQGRNGSLHRRSCTGGAAPVELHRLRPPARGRGALSLVLATGLLLQADDI